MDFMLAGFSLIVSISMLVTTLASIGFLVFLFLLYMERFEKKKLGRLTYSDFMSSQQRLS